MGGFSDYWEDKILDHLFDQAAYPAPNIYVGLNTGNPGEAGGYELPFTNGYARVYTYFLDWNSSVGGVMLNFEDIVFPIATDAWGVVTHFSLYDAATGGNMLAYGTLGAPIDIQFSDRVTFVYDDLMITLD